MMTKPLIATAVAILLAACGGAPTLTGGRVSIQADVSALAAHGTVIVKVDASPAGLTGELAYDAGTGRFSGSMALPAGLQILTVQALSDLDEDGELEIVAAGSGQVLVAENQTASVVVVLMDLTPPPPVPDHRPIITSAGVGNAHPQPGEVVSAWVSAVDVDEDPMTYLWSVDCNAGAATIADPTAAATTFTVDSAATCLVTATVSANGKVVSAGMVVQVGGSGQAEVTISFAAPPVVAQVSIVDQGSSFICDTRREDDEATCAGSLAMGALVDVGLSIDEAGEGAQTSLDVCGGLVTLVESGPGSVHYLWQAPQASGVCVVTGLVTRNGYVDAFPVALLLQ